MGMGFFHSGAKLFKTPYGVSSIFDYFRFRSILIKIIEDLTVVKLKRKTSVFDQFIFLL